MQQSLVSFLKNLPDELRSHVISFLTVKDCNSVAACSSSAYQIMTDAHLPPWSSWDVSVFSDQAAYAQFIHHRRSVQPPPVVTPATLQEYEALLFRLANSRYRMTHTLRVHLYSSPTMREPVSPSRLLRIAAVLPRSAMVRHLTVCEHHGASIPSQLWKQLMQTMPALESLRIHSSSYCTYIGTHMETTPDAVDAEFRVFIEHATARPILTANVSDVVNQRQKSLSFVQFHVAASGQTLLESLLKETSELAALDMLTVGTLEPAPLDLSRIMLQLPSLQVLIIRSQYPWDRPRIAASSDELSLRPLRAVYAEVANPDCLLQVRGAILLRSRAISLNNVFLPGLTGLSVAGEAESYIFV